MVQRLAVGVEYDGTLYKGWQKQKKHPTVQSELEKALAKIAEHPIHTICAGRTDTGVHAIGQVIHCDVQLSRKTDNWLFGANTYLPKDIRILWVKKVSQDFNARKTAINRRYCYIIYNHPIRPSLLRHQLTWCCRDLTVSKMQLAVQHWIGKHDFSSFRAADCQSSTSIRVVKSIEITRMREIVIIDIIANAFLHHMLRNMVGVLLSIGKGKIVPEEALTILKAKDRTAAGITAPPNGLYLTKVEYPTDLNLPKANSLLWFLN